MGVERAVTLEVRVILLTPANVECLHQVRRRRFSPAIGQGLLPRPAVPPVSALVRHHPPQLLGHGQIEEPSPGIEQVITHRYRHTMPDDLKETKVAASGVHLRGHRPFPRQTPLTKRREIDHRNRASR